MASPLNNTGFAPIQVSSWADEEEDVPLNMERPKPAIPERPPGVQMPGPHAVVVHGIPSNWTASDVGHLFSGLMIQDIYPHPNTAPSAIIRSFIVDFKEAVDLQWALTKPPSYHGKTFPVRPYHEGAAGLSRGSGRLGGPPLTLQHSDKHPYREGPVPGGSMRGPPFPGGGTGGSLHSHPSAPAPWDVGHRGEPGSGWSATSRSAASFDHRGPIAGGMMRSASDLRGTARSDADSSRWTHHPQAGSTTGLHSLASGPHVPSHAPASTLLPTRSTESMQSADRQHSAGLDVTSSASMSAPGLAGPTASGTLPTADSPVAPVAAPVQPKPRANPFGAAKPVDTASKLREIEEKAAAQRKEAEEAARRDTEARAKAEAEAVAAREAAEAEAEAEERRREEEAKAAAVAHAQAQALAAAAAAPAAMAMQRAVHDLAAANPQALCFGEIGPEYQPAASPHAVVPTAPLQNGQPGGSRQGAVSTGPQPAQPQVQVGSSQAVCEPPPPPPPPPPPQRNNMTGSAEQPGTAEVGLTDTVTRGMPPQPASSHYNRGGGGKRGRGRGGHGGYGRGGPADRGMPHPADAEHHPMHVPPPPPPPPPPPSDAHNRMQPSAQPAGDAGSEAQQQPAQEGGPVSRAGVRGDRGRRRGRGGHTSHHASAPHPPPVPASDHKQQQPDSNGTVTHATEAARAESAGAHATAPHGGGRRGGRDGRGRGPYGRRGGSYHGGAAGEDSAAAAAASASQAMTDLPSASSVPHPEPAPTAGPVAAIETGAGQGSLPAEQVQRSERKERGGPGRGGRGRGMGRGHVGGRGEDSAMGRGHPGGRGGVRASRSGAQEAGKSQHSTGGSAPAESAQEQHEQQQQGAGPRPHRDVQPKVQRAARSSEPSAPAARSSGKPVPEQPAPVAVQPPQESRAQSLFRKLGTDSKGPGPAKLKNTFALLAEAADD